jgi:hypothetical protein
MRKSVPVALLVVSMLPVSANAVTYCFDIGNTGCPYEEPFPKWQLRQLSCQELWYMRNSIYDWRGYCFKTQAEEKVFDNSNCSTWNAADLPFNSNEQINLSRIRDLEARGCAR